MGQPIDPCVCSDQCYDALMVGFNPRPAVKPGATTPTPINGEYKIMKNEILVEIAKVWIADAKEPEIQDGSDHAKLSNARAQGMREAKRECADTLKMLVETFKD